MLAKSLRSLFLVAGVLSAATAQVSAQPIKVGVPMILSGAGAQFGAPILDGARLYADQVNAGGGVLGRKIELVPRDTKSRPEEAVRVARELILRDKVDFLVGTFTSAEGTAISQVAKENEIVTIVPGPKTDRLTAPDQLHPYIFRTSGNTTTEGRVAAEIVASMKVKRVATIAPDFAYGRDAVTVFVAHLRKLVPDVQIVDQQWPKLNESDYTAFVTAQLAAKPEAVFSVICCGNFDAFVKQANALGYFKQLGPRLVAVGEAGSVEMLKALRDEYPVGIWGNTYDADNWESSPAHKAYLARVREVTKQAVPSSWVIQGYISMQFLVEAIKKANSVDALKVSAAMKGLTIASPQGPITMRAKDQQADRSHLWGQAAKVAGSEIPVLTNIRSIAVGGLMD
ncbi:ABC transporter substrate-binding protein [Variovorax sp. OV700]|uniref:ABC transporter substrate-binding protein n=1 Tax=Variovorax sp. OV700 TaxID=1882826 RepID=UPI0008809BE6|nr:ABC transporter substrate-binding protein [Variovorax sp. OV700]SDJ77767.1 amino acid/amide ABC transporter substrate-binding protein, HAAT family [Variovorax sp. OV700]